MISRDMVAVALAASFVTAVSASPACFPNRDPNGLLNVSLDGSAVRAIDISDDGVVDEGAFKALVRAAVAHNISAPPKWAARPASSGFGRTSR